MSNLEADADGWVTRVETRGTASLTSGQTHVVKRLGIEIRRLVTSEWNRKARWVRAEVRRLVISEQNHEAGRLRADKS